MKKTLILIFAAALAACGGQETITPAASVAKPPAATSTQAPPPPPPMISSAPAPGTLSGKVAETMNSGGYTYMLLKGGKGEQWVAVRETSVKVGQTVTIAPQLTLENFESSTLKRTFKTIVFATMADAAPAGSAVVPASMKVPPNHPNTNATGAMGSPAQHMSGGAATVPVAKVERAAGGRTVAEVWAHRKDLADKQVAVRGTVVKFLPDIMGANWMHIRDGSGSEASGDHDLTVTTDATVAKGDVVTVTGIVRVEKDFGAGYMYPVIIEKAKVSK